MDQFALITGASKGIGKALAISLAKRKFNLLLVARSAPELNTLKSELSAQYNVSVEVFALDLSVPGAAKRVTEWCTDNAFPVSVLVNNAGFGVWGKFETLPLNEQLNMLQLNITALTELTYYMLPLLRQNQPGYILNVSSTAAYQAVPTLALYAASKSYVLSFSRAIRYELKDSSISVTCLSPGPVGTGFAERAGLSAINDIAEKFNMDANVVAEIAVKAMLNRKAEVIPGFTNIISAYANRILPKSLIERITAGIYNVK
ncbi:SDR family NAD(P)-dependent oxidoreductase [Pedobacter steynii]